MYREVLHQELGELGEVERAKRPERLPVVLTREEVDRLLAGMSGTFQLMAKAEQVSVLTIDTRARPPELAKAFGEAHSGPRGS
jgi:site-specific recombinase XerD